MPLLAQGKELAQIIAPQIGRWAAAAQLVGNSAGPRFFNGGNGAWQRFEKGQAGWHKAEQGIFAGGLADAAGPRAGDIGRAARNMRYQEGGQLKVERLFFDEVEQ